MEKCKTMQKYPVTNNFTMDIQKKIRIHSTPFLIFNGIYPQAYTSIRIICIRKKFEDRYCLESIYSYFCYNTCFENADLFESD